MLVLLSTFSPDYVGRVRRQDGIPVDEVLHGPHGHDQEVLRSVRVVAR